MLAPGGLYPLLLAYGGSLGRSLVALSHPATLILARISFRLGVATGLHLILGWFSAMVPPILSVLPYGGGDPF
jgi:hypothetical protein